MFSINKGVNGLVFKFDIMPGSYIVNLQLELISYVLPNIHYNKKPRQQKTQWRWITEILKYLFTHLEQFQWQRQARQKRKDNKRIIPYLVQNISPKSCFENEYPTILSSQKYLNTRHNVSFSILFITDNSHHLYFWGSNNLFSEQQHIEK